MALIQDVAINVLMEAPECPSSVAEHAVIRATRELCRESGAWRVDIPWSDWNAGAETNNLQSVLDNMYGVDKLFGGDAATFRPEVLDILSIIPVSSEIKLQAATISQMDRDYPGWRDAETNSAPTHWVRDSGGIDSGSSASNANFYLYPQPQRDSGAIGLSNGATQPGAVSSALYPTITLPASADDHTFVPNQRVRFVGGWGTITSSASTDQAFYRAMLNSTSRVRSVPNARSFVLDSPNTVDLDWSLVDFTATPRIVTVDYDLRVSVMPKQGPETKALPDYFLRFHEEGIVAGALAYVLMMPQAPWTDLQKASYQRAMFDRAISNAHSRADDEHTTGVTRRTKYGGI